MNIDKSLSGECRPVTLAVRQNLLDHANLLDHLIQIHLKLLQKERFKKQNSACGPFTKNIWLMEILKIYLEQLLIQCYVSNI